MDNALQHALRGIGLAPALRPMTAKTSKAATKASPVYRYRGLPCSIASDDKLWFVEGVDARGGSGILEWCYDEDDAAAVLARMREFPQFSQLAAAKWKPGVGMHHLVAEALGDSKPSGASRPRM